MPRKGRETSSTGIYHVMLRGINRQDIFEGSEDYKSQSHDLRDVMIEIGSGPRQMSRISGMSYNIIQYMWKNNQEQ